MFDGEKFGFHFVKDIGFGCGNVGGVGIAGVEAIDIEGRFVGSRSGCGGQAAAREGGEAGFESSGGGQHFDRRCGYDDESGDDRKQGA